MTPTSKATIRSLEAMLAMGDDPCELPEVDRNRIADSLIGLVLELTPEAAALLPDDAVPRTLRTGERR